MNLSQALMSAAATAVIGVAMATPASAAPNANNSSGGAAGLIAAVVQANVQDLDVRVVTVETGDVNVAVTDVLNNNRVLTDFLNDNDVDIHDVVDIAIVDNVLVVDVL